MRTELYPRSQIDIVVRIVQDDGGREAAAINAVTLALIDAGIAVKDYVVAVAGGFIAGSAVVDLNHVECTMAGGPVIPLAIYPHTKEIVFLQQEQKLPLEHVEAVLALATDCCLVLFDKMREAVTDRTRAMVASRGVFVG